MNTSAHKIKLLICIPGLQCGGTEKYVSLLCNYINTDQFQVTLVILNNSDQFYPIKNKDISIIDLAVKNVRHSFFKIRRIVQQLQPDIIYSNANHLNLYFAIFKNFFSKRTLLLARESSVVSINSKRARQPLVYNQLVKQFYKRLDGIICQSVYMQEDLISNYNITKEKTILIHNPVEIDTTVSVIAKQQHKFITVARLSEEKGIERLIRSVAKLFIPFTWYIIGDGNKKSALQSLISELNLQDHIYLLGEKKDPFNGMEDAALFLMGSYYEGFPNALLEAAALGIPSVAFDVPGGVKEIIIDGQNGLLVKDNDEAAFTHAIEKALTINFNRQAIKENTGNNFSPAKIIAATERYFIDLLHKTSFSE